MGEPLDSVRLVVEQPEDGTKESVTAEFVEPGVIVDEVARTTTWTFSVSLQEHTDFGAGDAVVTMFGTPPGQFMREMDIATCEVVLAR